LNGSSVYDRFGDPGDQSRLQAGAPSGRQQDAPTVEPIVKFASPNWPLAGKIQIPVLPGFNTGICDLVVGIIIKPFPH
jgi:hypothetical protein